MTKAGVIPRLITSQEVLNSKEFNLFLKPLATSFEVEVTTESYASNSAGDIAKGLVDLCSKASAPLTYVPAGDGIAQIMGLTSRLAWNSRAVKAMANIELLMLGGKFGYPAPFFRQNRNRAVAWALNGAAWRSLFHLDPFQHKYLQQHGSRAAKLLPDPVRRALPITVEEARRKLGVPTAGRVIGCTGWIERSKGCHLLIDSFAAAAQSLPSDDRLFLAGTFRDGLQDYIETKYRNLLASERIIIVDRLLSEDEINWAIQSMDIVCLPYLRASQSSGVFLMAVAEGKPVLVNSSGWLKAMVDLLGNGCHVDVHEADLFSRAITKALNSAHQNYTTNDKKIERFLQFHSEENFQATWTKSLRQLVGCKDQTRVVNWDWIWLEDES